MAEEVTDVSSEPLAFPATVTAEPPATEESSTEEPKTEDATEESSDEPADDTEAEPSKDEEVETKSDEEPKPRTAEARKESLNNEIRDLVSKRNVLRDEITQQNAKVYQPQSAQDLIDEGQDPALARVEALEQRQQLAEYNAQVTDLNANLSIESLQVLADMPVFNPEAPEYDKELSDRAATYYQKVAGIQTDPQTGLIIAANVLPYDTYKQFAEIHAQGARNGQVKGQVAAEKMLAASDTPSSAAPKAPKEDNFLKGLRGSGN